MESLGGFWADEWCNLIQVLTSLFWPLLWALIYKGKSRWQKSLEAVSVIQVRENGDMDHRDIESDQVLL